MPRKKTGMADIIGDLAKAAFDRKTTQGKVNKTIDAFLEHKPLIDEGAHFINEVVIHKHPKQHVHNTMKYLIKPMLKKKLKL